MPDSFKSPNIDWTPDTLIADLTIYLRRTDGVVSFLVRRGDEALFDGREFTAYGDVLQAIASLERSQAGSGSEPVSDWVVESNVAPDVVTPVSIAQLDLFA